MHVHELPTSGYKQYCNNNKKNLMFTYYLLSYLCRYDQEGQRSRDGVMRADIAGSCDVAGTDWSGDHKFGPHFGMKE